MVSLKQALAALTAGMMVICLAACGQSGEGDGQLKSGELIVEENDSAIHLALIGYDTLNPLVTQSATVQEYISLIYEPLFDFDEAANPVPVLAKDYTLSPDGLTLRVELADGIKWQDGRAFSAGDVVFTFQEIKSRECAYSDDLENIAAAAAEGDRWVCFTLAKPLLNPEMLLSFPILPAGTEMRTGTGTDFQPVGTGPYGLDGEKTTANALVLAANSQWHGGKPAADRIVLDVVRDKDAAVYAFEANEVNALTSSTLDLKQSTPRGKFYVYDYTSNRLLFLGINNQSENFAQADVRRALGFMLNKQEMIENEMYTHAVEVDVPVNPSAWFARKLDKSRQAQADINQIMVSAGWEKQEDGFYYKTRDGEKIKFQTTVLVNGDNDEKNRLARRIAGQLTMAGVETEVRAVSFQEYNRLIDSGDYSLFLGEVMLGKNMDPTFLTETSGEGNYFFYENAALNQRLSPASLTKDTEVRRQCFAEYGDLFLEETPFIPLFFRTESVIYDSRISGNKMPTLFRPYRDMDTWYFSKKDKTAD